MRLNSYQTVMQCAIITWLVNVADAAYMNTCIGCTNWWSGANNI